ncbi:YciI family protein [Sphingomonas sp. 28-63-12]|uniref:YciI family protein n=1 Tax=Sphingomonas sp. 28-63-12 TaxID=1970434 RepID=UPI000BD37E37|nr:MAG: hypothetical protein B7Y47_02605 [Sphingomonas sp. 28-63-12]
MTDYILLMHRDADPDVDDTGWDAYFDKLSATGMFQGGSSIGDGICINKAGRPPPVSAQLGGFIRIQAPDLATAQTLVIGNPVFEAGGTIEIRELPKD